jgi:transposase
MSSEDFQIAHLVLPEGILDFFILNKTVQSEESIHIYLEEKNIRPIEDAKLHLTSKGFF